MIEKLLSLYKLFLKKSNLKKSRKNIVYGNSILMDSFRISGVLNNKVKVRIGDNCMLQCNIIFESDEGEIIIGDRVFIGNSVLISRSKIEFENDIFVAWGCYFYDHDSHSMDFNERQNDIIKQLDDYRSGKNFIESKDWSVVNSKPIHICSNAWIGMNCIILKGVIIGEGAIVGAGSVVTKDVPAWSVVAGNPAKVIKYNEIKKII